MCKQNSTVPVQVEVPVGSASKAIAILSSYGLAPKKSEITDSTKALISLKSYGLTAEGAQSILDTESIIAFQDYDREQNVAYSPELIEIFGVQHITDALYYTYMFMDDFNLEWSEYKEILYILLKVYKPEQLISSPEYIRCFLSALNNKALPVLYQKLTGNDDYDPKNVPVELDLSKPSVVYPEILDELTREDIEEMSTTPLFETNLDKIFQFYDEMEEAEFED